MRERTHVSLFTGIGGFDLACDWLGIRTVLQCECDPFCLKVLEHHWPDVPRIRDVREVTKETYKRLVADTAVIGCDTRGAESTRQQGQTGVADGGKALADARCQYGPSSRGERKTTEGEGVSGRDNRGRSTGNASRRQVTTRGTGQDTQAQPPFILTGGFPCQPFSCAGKRKGKEDDRFLWPEMLRVIEELRPRWVLGENVAGIVGMVQFDSQLEVDTRFYTEEEKSSGRIEVGRRIRRTGTGVLDSVMGDLEQAGYTVYAPVVPACAVNAPHRRDRVWIVGYSSGGRQQEQRQRESNEAARAGVELSGQDVADAGRCGQPSRWASGLGWWEREPEQALQNARAGGWQEDGLSGFESVLGRVASGIPHRVDRLRSLGNAIVPQVAYEIIRAMIEVENQ